MVRTKEVARMSTGDKFPPRHLQVWQTASFKARKIVAEARQKATGVVKAPPKLAPVAVQALKPGVAVQADPVGAPVCKLAALEQKATKTLTNPSNLQKVTKALASKKSTVSEASASSAEIDVDVFISIPCEHCQKRQRLDTEVVELCRREENHPNEVIDLSELADSD